MPSHILKH